MKRISYLLLALMLTACSATDIDTKTAELGENRSLEDLKSSLNSPGILTFEKHTAADWAVNLSGLLNLNHPKAIAANIEDRLEPIQIYTYHITHPTRGTYIIDSGVSQNFETPNDNDDVSYLVKSVMGIDLLEVKLTTQELDTRLGGIDGVFLTHIHMDHIMGLTDLDPSVPVYIGPGDADAKALTNLATIGTTNNLLANVSSLLEWDYSKGGYIDVFGDGSFWAIHSPGHTPGATAYLANTTSGPQLMLGDVTHTQWGWENGVEPGTFSADVPTSAKSLLRLVELAQEFPMIDVHPGHQSL